MGQEKTSHSLYLDPPGHKQLKDALSFSFVTRYNFKSLEHCLCNHKPGQMGKDKQARNRPGWNGERGIHPQAGNTPPGMSQALEGSYQLRVCGTKLLLLSRFSRVRLCATQQMAAHQAPLCLGFSRHEHWSGLPETKRTSQSLKLSAPQQPAEVRTGHGQEHC